MELKRAGLLEVLFEAAKAPAGRFARQMNAFRQNPFYDPALLAARIGALSKRYPARVVAAARDLAGLIGFDADAERIEALCSRLAAVGVKRGAEAARIILRFSPGSTRRTFDYVLELLGPGERGRYESRTRRGARR